MLQVSYSGSWRVKRPQKNLKHLNSNFTFKIIIKKKRFVAKKTMTVILRFVRSMT